VANVLVTGSADGIGRQTALMLVEQGHRVVLHARTDARADEVRAAVPAAAGVVVGDLSSLAETHQIAKAASAAGPFDAIVHSAWEFEASHMRPVTVDGLERTFQVTVLAPYLLTALIPQPQRLIYLTSGLQAEGVANLEDLQRERSPWDAGQAYCDSQLYVTALAFAVARHWSKVFSNTVDPGSIKTRMDGPHLTDKLSDGAETQIWLAVSDDPNAAVTGRYFKRRQDLRANRTAYEHRVQDALLAACAELCGVRLPD
jgi:NAD(P)-dependent dehydrogenase (short-subunit alcohol dehydrogenase family)